ncbi:pyrolysin [Ceratobasidium sp. AG-Ba]|nr:pyrolysin [Ceratobasidium sp. AG-Ba]
MDAFNRLEAAQKQMASAASEFHHACTAIDNLFRCRNNNTDQEWLEKRLSAIDRDLDSLAGIEQKLALSRISLHRVANRSKIRVLIHTLPEEILARIFGIVMVSFDPNLHPPEATLHPTCVLSTVCASWRALAINTPLLWNNIKLREGSEAGHSMMIRRALLWLKRSGDVPADLTFYAADRCQDNLDPQIGQILTRAKSFVFPRDSSEDYAVKIFRLYDTAGRSDILKTVSMRGPFQIILHGPRKNWWDCIPPCLTTLDLCRLSSVMSLNFDELVALLERCSNLESITLTGVFLGQGTEGTYPKVILPNLKYLKTALDTTVSEVLFSTIAPGRPGLQLSLSMPEVEDQRYQDSVCRFMECSHVTELSLHELCPYRDDSILAQYLDCLPELRSLSLDISEDRSGRLLDALVVSIDQNEYRARRPTIRTLTIISGLADSLAQQRLKRIVIAYSLKELVAPGWFLYEYKNSARDDGESLEEWLRKHIETVQKTGS